VELSHEIIEQRGRHDYEVLRVRRSFLFERKHCIQLLVLDVRQSSGPVDFVPMIAALIEVAMKSSL
jgi:hypothetical protein